MRVKRSFAKRAASAKRKGRTGYANVVRTSAKRRRVAPAVQASLRRLDRMIETKEVTHTLSVNQALTQNQLYEFTDRDSGIGFNMFRLGQGVVDVDAHANLPLNRIGDAITVRGVKLRFFLENALNRPKVYYRIMLLKGPRGQQPTRANVFRGRTDNKMIDDVDTKFWTILWSKQLTIQTANPAPTGADLTGVPVGNTGSGPGTRVVSAWIPGAKFGRGGNLQYEQGSVANIKFFDFHIVYLAYDWYGTPQDVNTVGRVNEMFSTVYFKDA